jgi:hypothetical protein
LPTEAAPEPAAAAGTAPLEERLRRPTLQEYDQEEKAARVMLYSPGQLFHLKRAGQCATSVHSTSMSVPGVTAAGVTAQSTHQNASLGCHWRA